MQWLASQQFVHDLQRFAEKVWPQVRGDDAQHMRQAAQRADRRLRRQGHAAKAVEPRRVCTRQCEAVLPRGRVLNRPDCVDAGGVAERDEVE